VYDDIPAWFTDRPDEGWWPKNLPYLRVVSESA
jgi:hypothetical protein